MIDRYLHHDGQEQDWIGGPPIDPREAEVEAHYRDWIARQEETDKARDQDQDRRAVGPSEAQAQRCRELDEEEGRFTAL